jgi:2-hydroxy-4-carboxymuconate semialdehyde hemiacetal dehydrogenase
MDMSIQLRSESDKLCTLALSFNNAGPLGTRFRYICDEGTYVASYDHLVDGDGVEVIGPTSGTRDGVELQDREFITAIEEGRAPNSSIDSVIDCYKILGKLQLQLDHQGRPSRGSTGRW